MAIVLDEATRAEYLAQTLASSRAAGVVSALGSTVYAEVYDGLNVLRASGTMTAPWAISSGSTITIGEVNASAIYVSSGGVPTSDWYCQFRGSNGRFVRGTFGVSGSNADFVWNQSSFQTGSRGTLGTLTLTAQGAVALAPSNTAVPILTGTAQVGATLTSSDGTWANGVTSYSRQWQRSDNGSTGWLAISGATSGTYTLTTSDQAKYVRSAITATNASGSSTAYSAASGPIASASASVAVTTVTVTGTAGQTLPFTTGVAFARGAVPSTFTADISAYQVSIKRRWNDGSVKHAILSGRVTFTSSSRTVVISTGTPPSGTALTSADIASSGVTATVQCGAFGNVSLVSLLASPVRTWVSGPEMVECHYRGDIGGGTLLLVWFHVRLFADGRKWVRAIVENGYLDNGSRSALAANATRTYVPTITVGGTTVYNNGGASISHWANSRYMAEGWVGSDPGTVATQSRTDLMATKLVPYIGFQNPSEAALSAQAQTYTPLGYGNVSANMSATAYQDQIGVFPRWDALYLNSGDPRAYRSVLANAGHFNTHAVVWRDATTREPFRLTHFGTWTVYGPSQGGTPDIANGDVIAGTPSRWNLGHFGSSGYLAYLLTGDYWHYETMAFGALMPYLATTSLGGNGTSRALGGEPRGIAWPLRSMAQYAALATDDDNCAADVKTWLAYNHTYFGAMASPEPNQTGFPFAFNNYDGAGGPVQQAPWQFWFLAQSNGHAWDIEPYSGSYTSLKALRDFMYKIPVGMLGDATGYYYTWATPYQMVVGPNNAAVFSFTPGTQLYQTWAQIWAANGYTSSMATGNTLQGSSAGAPTGAKDYWGQLHATIAWALEHGAPGAYEAYQRLTSASNWLSGIVNSTQQPMADYPQNATTPRTAVPAWVPAAGTFKNIGSASATLNSVKPSGWPSGDAGGPFALWSSAVYAEDFSSLGAFVVHGSGHVDGGPVWGGVWCFDLDDLTWKGRNVPPAPLIDAGTNYYNGYNVYGESTGTGVNVASTVGHTYVPHVYDGLAYMPASSGGGAKGSLLRVFHAGSGYGWPIHKFDLSSATAPATRVVDGVYTSGDNYPSCCADTTRNGLWIMRGNGVNLRFVSFANWSVTSYVPDFASYGNVNLIYMPPPYDAILAIGAFGSAPNISTAVWVSKITGSTPGTFTKVTTSGTGPVDTRVGGCWSTILNCAVSYEGGGTTTVHKLIPPAVANLTSGTWSWTTEALTGVGGAVPSFNANNYQNGSWSRFIEVPKARCFLWCDSINQQVQAWRLSGM